MDARDVMERVVILETQVELLQEDIKEILAELKTVNSSLTKFRGFMGGIWFIVGSLPIIWTLGKDWIKSHWS